jgi:hypothetical protein
MAKKNTGTRPKVATLPTGSGVSAKLRDYLATASESAKPPSSAGKSTGSLPQNRKT